MATGSEALESQGIDAARLSMLSPFISYGGCCELLSWRPRIQNKNALQSVGLPLLEIYCAI